MYKYYVASVYVNQAGVNVSYYAFKKGAYGLHKTENREDPAILYYDTEKEALEQRYNANDCVLSRYFDKVPSLTG